MEINSETFAQLIKYYTRTLINYKTLNFIIILDTCINTLNILSYINN